MSLPLPLRHLLGAAVRRAAPRDGESVPSDSPDFLADLHSLQRQFLAYRRGQLDGRRHSVDDTASYFGLDGGFAHKVDRYLAARRRLQASRTGWQAGVARCR